METIGLLLAKSLTFTVLAIIIMYIVKRADDWRTPFNEDEEINQKRNLAIALRKSGIFLGMSIGLAGALWGTSGSFRLATDVAAFIEDGILMMVLLFVAFLVNKKLILWEVDNDQALQNGNAAVGTVEFANYVASGLIMNGAFSGDGGGLLTAIVFFAIAQLAFVVSFTVYSRITQRNICHEIDVNGNIAEGVDLAGLLLAISLILRASIAGPFTGWVPGIITFLVYFVIGLVFLLMCRFACNRIFLPGASYDKEIKTDQNVGAATISSMLQIAVAVIIAACF